MTQADAGTPPPEDVEADERICDECAAPLDPDQRYCLQCGAPTDRAPVLGRTERNGWLVVGALIALAAISGAVAWAVARDSDAGSTTATQPAETVFTDPTTDSAPTTGGELPVDTTNLTNTLSTTSETPLPPVTDTITTTTGSTSDSLTTTTTPTTTAPAAESDWPARRTGWTAVVSSVRDGDEAVATKQRVLDAGEPAGLLYSSDHTGLEPGFWVVFSGIYPSHSQAAAHARAIGGQFPGSYPREISSPN